MKQNVILAFKVKGHYFRVTGPLNKIPNVLFSYYVKGLLTSNELYGIMYKVDELRNMADLMFPEYESKKDQLLDLFDLIEKEIKDIKNGRYN